MALVQPGDALAVGAVAEETLFSVAAPTFPEVCARLAAAVGMPARAEREVLHAAGVGVGFRRNTGMAFGSFLPDN